MFRSGRTRPAHAQSSGSEGLLRIRSLAAYIIGTLDSRFRKRQAGETAPEALLCANRGHWGIEIMHRNKDVILGEDGYTNRSDNTPRNPEICLAFTNPRHRTISGRQEQGPSPVLRLTLPPFLLNRPAVFISAVDTTADTTWSRRRKEIRPRLRPGVFEPRVLRAGKQLAGLEEMVDLLEGFYPAESGAL
jgi:hypothetical protein